MDMADAVVILLTPDDVGYVRSAFRRIATAPMSCNRPVRRA